MDLFLTWNYEREQTERKSFTDDRKFISSYSGAYVSIIKMAVPLVNWSFGPNPLDLVASFPVAAKPTHIILAAVGLVPSKMTAAHRTPMHSANPGWQLKKQFSHSL